MTLTLTVSPELDYWSRPIATLTRSTSPGRSLRLVDVGVGAVYPSNEWHTVVDKEPDCVFPYLDRVEKWVLEVPTFVGVLFGDDKDLTEIPIAEFFGSDATPEDKVLGFFNLSREKKRVAWGAMKKDFMAANPAAKLFHWHYVSREYSHPGEILNSEALVEIQWV